MRVVLFGAGASYGSGSVAPRVPPLGVELFPALRRLYQHWRAIPAAEAELFATDFEAGMAEVIEKYGMAVAPLMQEMAMFFSVFGIQRESDNRYRRLIQNLVGKRDDVIWSTVNYECLLEAAGTLAGLQIGYFADPKEDAHVLPVWKLHGSCNFKVTGLKAGRGVSFGTGVVFSGGIEPINPNQVIPTYSGHTALYPAMALYAKGKPVSMSPEPIKQAQERWREAVLAADKVAIVGVHPNPEDEHLWEPLADTAATVGYIGAQTPFGEWVASYRENRDSEFLGTTWSSADDQLLDFLSG